MAKDPVEQTIKWFGRCTLRQKSNMMAILSSMITRDEDKARAEGPWVTPKSFLLMDEFSKIKPKHRDPIIQNWVTKNKALTDTLSAMGGPVHPSGRKVRSDKGKPRGKRKAKGVQPAWMAA